MLRCQPQIMITSQHSIIELIQQLNQYPSLTHHQKFSLGINLGICVSHYLVSQKKTSSDKFDMLFYWLLSNNKSSVCCMLQIQLLSFVQVMLSRLNVSLGFSNE